MKKIIFIGILFILCFFNVYADEDLAKWKGMDIVVIEGMIYEYNLYIADVRSLDNAVRELLDNFWDYEADIYNATFSVNRFYYLENNRDLYEGVKRMMRHNKVNISTTKYFDIENGRIILRYTINFTKDFVNYSFIHTWDEVKAWR